MNILHLYNRLRTDTRTAVADLCEDGKGLILASVGAGWFLSIGVRYMYPSILPFVRTEYGLGLTVSGLILSALWVAYALGQFPGGVLGDRVGEGNILFYSTILSTVAIVLVALSTNIWMLILGTIAFGFATALFGPTRFTIFTSIYSKRSGLAIGLTMAAGSIGNTVIPAVAATIASYYSWRLGMGVLIPFFVFVIYGLWVAVPGRTSERSEEVDTVSIRTVRTLLSAIRKDGIPIVVGVQVLITFVSQGFLGFYPIYLIEVKGFSPQIAAILYGLYFAVGIVIQPITGMSRDRFGAKWTLTALLCLYFIGLGFLQFGTTVLHLLLLTVILSHRNGTGVVNNTYIADTLNDDIKGSGLGLLRTMWILISATSPVFVGFLGDLGRFTMAFNILAVITAVAIALSLLVPDE